MIGLSFHYIEARAWIPAEAGRTGEAPEPPNIGLDYFLGRIT